ncbi:hypothetical protein ACA910_019199 [Epithemia clementina (nom. ined.)]
MGPQCNKTFGCNKPIAAPGADLWKTTVPSTGEGNTKQVNGEQLYWCATCNHWNCHHTTNKHNKGFNAKKQKNKNNNKNPCCGDTAHLTKVSEGGSDGGGLLFEPSAWHVQIVDDIPVDCASNDKSTIESEMVDSDSNLFASNNSSNNDNTINAMDGINADLDSSQGSVSTTPSTRFCAMNEMDAPNSEHHDRWQDHHDSWLIAERTQYPPLFTPHSDKDNSDFTAPVDWLSDDATIALTATVDNFGKVVEEEEETAEPPRVSDTALEPNHGVARRAAAMALHQDTITAQREATDFTNIGPLPNMTNWFKDPVPTMDSVIQEMRNLCTTTATSSIFHVDNMTNILASEAVLLVA